MKKIAVIGTGLSALSLAYHLPALDITFFEKSWRPGGRISTRKHNQYAFDHGAHYLKLDHGIIGLNEYLNKIRDKIGSDNTNKNQLKAEIKNITNSEKAYEEFDKMFTQVYPKFYKRLNASAKLSKTDIRLASYIKMNHK